MIDLTKVAALTLGLCLAAAASAQEATTTEAPAATDAPAADTQATGGLSMGQELPAEGDAAAPQDGPGSVYIAGKHGDWEQRCVKAQDGSDPCQLYQLLKDPSGNPVAEISLFGLPEGNEAAAGASIIAPLETLLTENLVMQVDTGKAKVYPFTFCTREGCVARLGLTAEEIALFKKGNKAKITIVPVVAPDQKVVLEVSLAGFTAGYDAVNAANTANAAAPSGN